MTVKGNCWLWTGRVSSFGYGRIYLGKKGIPAHRVSYEYHIGPIPPGLVIDHLCRVTSCVNPAHLEPVTDRENILRGVGPTARRARLVRCERGHELKTLSYRRGRFCETCRYDRENTRAKRRWARDKAAGGRRPLTGAEREQKNRRLRESRRSAKV